MRTTLWVCFLAFLALDGSLRAADPFVGTWKLNVAKSKYSEGQAPKTQTRTYEPFEGDGVTLTNETVRADGSHTKWTFSAHYDGKDYPYTGNPGLDTIAMKRIDPYTIDIAQKKAGKVVQTGRIVVSKDGKMLTSATKGTDASDPYTNVQVFDRQ
jgi:hypothetical protein